MGDKTKYGMKPDNKPVVGLDHAPLLFVKMMSGRNDLFNLGIISMVADTCHDLNASLRMLTYGIIDHLTIVKEFVNISVGTISVVVCINQHCSYTKGKFE